MAAPLALMSLLLIVGGLAGVGIFFLLFAGVLGFLSKFYSSEADNMLLEEAAEAERLAKEQEEREARERERLEQIEKAKQERQNYIDNLRTMDKSKVICLDVETTGLSCDDDEILQLSIIDGNNDVLFNEYIKPRQRKRWPKAQEVHGISYQMVKDKPTIDEHIPMLNKIIEDAEIIVGYNIDGFDIDFIRAAGVSVPVNKKTFDVMLEFAEIYGEWNDYHGDYKWQKLATCAKYYNYENNGQFHDSLEDIRATLFCYYAMLESNMQPK